MAIGTDPGLRWAWRPPWRPACWPLAVLAVVVVAATTLAGAGTWPGATHLVALPPLDLIADIGVILVVADSPIAALGLVMASLVIRAGLLAVLLGRPDRHGFAFAVRFYLLVWPLGFLAAALLHTSFATLFYALFWFGVAVALALFAASASIPWLARPEVTIRRALARAWGQRLRLGTLGAYLVALLADRKSVV